jgi:cytochrome P450
MATVDVANPSITDYDPLSYDEDDPYQEDRFPGVLARSPVYFDPRYELYFALSYETVKQVLGDWKRFSSEGFIRYPEVPEPIAEQLPDGYPQVSAGNGNLAGLDPPVHAKLRKPANRGFRQPVMAALEPDLAVITSDLLDEFAADGRADIIEQFCEPLPIRVVSHLLNIAVVDYESVRKFTEDSFALTFHSHAGEKSRTEVADLVEMSQSSIYWQATIEAAIADREVHPGNDLISQWLHATDDAGQRVLTHAEVVSLTCLSLFAGTDTSVGILGHAIRSMIEHPAAWDEIRADRSLIVLAVEELIRQREPGRGVIRRATHDTELGGVPIPVGANVYGNIYTANRDPAVFADPEAFDIHRPNLKEHLGFGFRTHFCLGAPLIRCEARVAINQILDRMANLRYADGARYGYRATDPVAVRPKSHIGVEWDAG